MEEKAELKHDFLILSFRSGHKVDDGIGADVEAGPSRVMLSLTGHVRAAEDGVELSYSLELATSNEAVGHVVRLYYATETNTRLRGSLFYFFGQISRIFG